MNQLVYFFFKGSFFTTDIIYYSRQRKEKTKTISIVDSLIFFIMHNILKTDYLFKYLSSKARPFPYLLDFVLLRSLAKHTGGE